jgi:hypothetical protein
MMIGIGIGGGVVKMIVIARDDYRGLLTLRRRLRQFFDDKSFEEGNLNAIVLVTVQILLHSNFE